MAYSETSAKTAKLLISNFVNGAPLGDYAAEIELGPEKSVAQVILDTGSSTLAVWDDRFGSAFATATNYIQFVGYGTGHWAGPVMKAQVGMGTGPHYIDLPDAYISQIQSGIYRGQRQFHPADGILGLAYRSLNTAADAGTTSFPVSKYDSAYKWYMQTSPRVTNPLPTVNLDPFFTELETAGLTPNKFAFITRRSNAHNGADPAADPLNKGWFILGGGEEHTELYTGNFQVVKEIDDPNGNGKYYNSNLMEIQIGNGPPISVEPPPFGSGLLSNSIVDSGTNALAFSPSLFQELERQLEGLGLPLPTPETIGSWPSIFVTLEGEGGVGVKLEIKPDTYWQLDSIAPGRNTATVTGTFLALSNSQMPQSILGLPLMNNYYVVFDRSGDSPGEVKFATPNPSGFPS